VRKDRFRVRRTEHRDDDFEEGLYATDATDAVYEQLATIARHELEHGGRSVVLDASWRERDHREAARAAARGTASPIVEVLCEVPREVAAARMQQRRAAGGDVSDATAAIAEAMAQSFDDWPEAIAVDTQSPASACADTVDTLIADARSRVG